MSEQIKYEAVFGDQSLFDGLMTDCEFASEEYGYSFANGRLYYCERYNEKAGWSLSCKSHLTFKPSAMRRIIKTPVQHSDDVAVDLFAARMKEKLEKSRDKGRSGWESCPIEHLIASLKDHISKGDPVDVANFAMMISQRGESIKTPVWTETDRRSKKLPEIGCRVNFCHKLNSNWRTGEIKYIDDQVTVIKADDIDRPFVYEVERVEFKPIESTEEKAARLRAEWYTKARELYRNSNSDFKAVYDALLSGDLPVPVNV